MLTVGLVEIVAQYEHFGEQTYTGAVLFTSPRPVLLHWENCVIKTFGDDFVDFNHVEYRDTDGSLRGIGDRNGALVDLLCQLDYPHKFQEIPDEETYHWFLANQSEVLEVELKKLTET